MTEINNEQFINYIDCVGEIPLDIPENSYISINRDKPLKIHSLGFQPAKSIPEIPRWFLNKYAIPSPEFIVLEPFAGGGTTLIESLNYGTSIYWMDNNPLSKLMCKVKSTYYSPLELSSKANNILDKSINQENAKLTINFKNKDLWFQKDVQDALEILREHITDCKSNVKDLLWVIYSVTVRKVSDMEDGMILASRRANNREIPIYSRQDVYDYFKYYLDKAIAAIEEWNPILTSSTKFSLELQNNDARLLEGDWVCDAIITSPPYINAIDYIWASKFELHWLGLVKNDDERLELCVTEIGTERIKSKEYNCLGKTGNKYLDRLLKDIYDGTKYKASKGQNALRSRVTYRYFNDMKKHFENSYIHLRPGGYYCFTIGDVSKICGVDIPVAEILEEIALEIGFNKIFQFNILLKNRRLNVPRNVKFAGTIKHDTTIILQKP